MRLLEDDLHLGNAGEFFLLPPHGGKERLPITPQVWDVQDMGGASLQPLSHTFPLMEMEGAEQRCDGFSELTWYFSCRDNVEFSRSSLYFFSSAFHIETSSTEGPCASLHLWVGVYFQRRAVFTGPTEECGFISKKLLTFFFYHFKLTVNIDIYGGFMRCLDVVIH